MSTSRRSFCVGLGGGAAGALLYRGLRARSGEAGKQVSEGQAAAVLRPPGARAGGQFLATCIRCSLCVDACPYDTLRSEGPLDGLSSGSPYFNARENPCRLCPNEEELLCVAACPSAALEATKIEEIDIGVAEIDRSICLAYNGATCRACWHACPFPYEAIRYDTRLRPVVDADKCIGCGLCEHACLTEKPSIVIRARRGDT